MSEKAKKTKKRARSKALVLQQVSMNPHQRSVVGVPTPEEFIKTRKGKKGKTFTYVEGGYVVARLNQAFSPLGWDFTILEKGFEKELNEVWVRGRLTIKDHKHGYEVSKEQFGTKKYYKNDVELGDTFKAAATDCLKKCASLFGIASDVYWGSYEEGEPVSGREIKVIQKEKRENMLDKSLRAIARESNKDILAGLRKNINASTLYKQAEKQKLNRAITKRENELS